MPNAALTPRQKDFLAVAARTDAMAEQVAAYRELGLEGADDTDKSVEKRIHLLLDRPDAQIVVKAHRERRAAIIRQDLIRADHAVGETLISAEQMHQDALTHLYDVAMAEKARYEEDPKRGAKALVDAWDKVRRATEHQGGRVGLTEEEALTIVEERLRLRKDKRVQATTGDPAMDEAIELLSNAKPIGSA